LLPTALHVSALLASHTCTATNNSKVKRQKFKIAFTAF